MNRFMMSNKFNNNQDQERSLSITTDCKTSRGHNRSRTRKTNRHPKLLRKQDTDNEFSTIDLVLDSEVKSEPSNIAKKSDSNDSLIYMGTVYISESPKPESVIPIIDLTDSRESSQSTELFKNSKQLKTIFFPERNFQRDIEYRKSLATTSLVNLPITKKIDLKKFHSSLAIERNKLSIMNIPSHFLLLEDLMNYNQREVSKKAELTPSDHEMIDWILEQENQNFQIDLNLSSSSPSSSSLDSSTMSIEEVANVYDVSSDDCF